MILIHQIAIQSSPLETLLTVSTLICHVTARFQPSPNQIQPRQSFGPSIYSPTSPIIDQNEPLLNRPLCPRARLPRVHNWLPPQRTHNLRAIQPQRGFPRRGARRRHCRDLRRGNQWRSTEAEGPYATSAEFELEQGWQVSFDEQSGLEVQYLGFEHGGDC